MRKLKEPKNIDGDGDSHSCYHVCVMSERLRFQVNARDVLYSTDPKEIRKIAKFLIRAADYLQQEQTNPTTGLD